MVTSFACRTSMNMECVVARRMTQLTLPILLVIGTTGNAVTVAVLSRRPLRCRPATVILLFLAVSDAFFLWNHILRQMFLRVYGTDLRDSSSFHCLIYDFLMATLFGFSSWLLVLLTLERYLYTLHSNSRDVKLSRRKVVVIILLMLVVIVILNTGMLFHFRLLPVHRNSSVSYARGIADLVNVTNGSTGADLQCRVLTGVFGDVYVNYWKPLGFILLTIAPSLLIFSGNLCILILVLIQRRKATAVGRRVAMKNATKLLFLLSVFYIITTTPFSVLRVKVKYNNAAMSISPQLQLFDSVAHILVDCNFTFNFVLYSVTGSVFRKEWFALVTDLCDLMSRVRSTCSSAVSPYADT